MFYIIILEVAAGMNLRERYGEWEMNRFLIDATLDIAKAKAIVNAIDELYMEAIEDDHQGLFYALIDEINQVSDDLDKLSEDMRVVDAIYAVNAVDRMRTAETEH